MGVAFRILPSTTVGIIVLLVILRSTEADVSCDDMNLNATSERQNITSPNYPNPYPRPLSCQWLISAPEDHVIHFWVVHFDVFISVSCYNDNFRINDGPSYMYSEYVAWCGQKSPQLVRLSGNSALVRFSAYSPGSPAPGFLVEYWAVLNPPAVVLEARYTTINYLLAAVSSVIVVSLIAGFLIIIIVRNHWLSRRPRHRNRIYDAMS